MALRINIAGAHALAHFELRQDPDVPDANDCPGKKGKNACNPEVIKRLEQISIQEENHADPRWKALKDIKLQ